MKRCRVMIFLVLFSLSGAAASGSVEIVKNGVSAVAIVTAPDASKQTLDAANLLAAYIEKSTGAKIPVNGVSAAGQPVIIHVGMDDAVRSFGLGVEKLDGDGFVIAAPDGRNVVIAGPTDWGTEFGVYEFLERFAGVRWLMPGKWGEDVPKRKSLAVPRGVVKSEPAYFSRQLSAPNGDEFARRNRHHPRVSFHHYLLYLFPPSKYAKTHLEFYPIWDGKRFLPTRDDEFMWQPCFSADGIVEEAAKNIKEYFRANPEVTSYSLGMNDTDHFCQCPKCLAKENPEKNFLGYRDYSDAYFEWANKVVEEVLKEYPDKWFGTLAYWCLAQPPKHVKVHPRIIPYMTYGRIRWFDPELKAEGHRLTEWWKSTSPTLGWYDYIYGTPYILPRVFFHGMADYLKWGRDAGVRASYAEIYYNWGEGPKEYLALKLQWNPDIDVDATLRDWYEHAVGKAAAPDLAAYYALWEDFWTRRIRTSSWYTKDEQWMKFYDPGYLDIVMADDLSKSRRFLESALRKADTEARRKRAEYLLRSFEYYEASALSLAPDLRACASPPSSEKEALGFLASAERAATMTEKRWRLVGEFSKDPVLNLPLTPDQYWRVGGDRWGCYPLWASYEWAKNGGAAGRELDLLAKSPAPSMRSHAVLMRGVIDHTVMPINPNPGFDMNLDRWIVTSGDKGSAAWTGAGGHSGAGALAVKGECAIEQAVPFIEGGGLVTCLVFVKGEGAAGTAGEAELVLEPGKAGTITTQEYDWLPMGNRCIKVVKVRPGGWTPVTATIDLANIPADRKADSLTFRLRLRNFPAGSTVVVDDAGMYAHK
jgi:hypothetical protein